MRDLHLHPFIVCMKLQKELVIGVDMQLIPHLGCGWTDDGQMFLNQGMDILINSIDAVVSIANLKKLLAMCRFSACIVSLPTKVADKCIASTP